MHRLIKDGELILYGPVGFVSFWDDDGFTSAEVISALAELEGDLTVRLNSGGGIAFDGIAIHNALKARETKVTVYIDAIAASAASAIAMAGDEIHMRDGAMLMVHDASGITLGTAEDHEKQASALHKLDGELARIYARRTGKPVAEIRRMMDKETWLDGPEAIEQGFATKTDDDESAAPTAFEYHLYAHAPERLVAMAPKRRTARIPRAPKATASSGPTSKESTMDWKDITADGLKQHRPDLATALSTPQDITAQLDAAKATASTQAAEAERKRIAGIQAAMFPGQEALAAEMINDGKTSPGDAALRFNQAEKAKGTGHLQALADADTQVSGLRPAPTATGGGQQQQPGKQPVAQTPEGWKAEYQASEPLQAEFGSEAGYLAFKKAEKDGRVRIKTSIAA